MSERRCSWEDGPEVCWEVLRWLSGTGEAVSLVLSVWGRGIEEEAAQVKVGGEVEEEAVNGEEDGGRHDRLEKEFSNVE